ncbi:MAG: amidohydrolase [Calditrichaeota bacterium]|nr:MAG: amidohydrolase [Calditrichota bacterium]MBL1205311.1 amidohydrolase [Calditrichota bacterium]NOG45140.1 amidohydrolase family protein [Calditrichota bacterium]
MLRLVFFFLIILATFLFAQTTPQSGLSSNTPDLVVYMNARISNPGLSKVSNTLILDGKTIVAVGDNLKPPKGSQIIDTKGGFIYPGFIEPYTRYGVQELKKGKRERKPKPTISRTGMIHWNAAVKPQRSAANEFNANAKKAEEWRKSGFTFVQTNGIDGLFQGSAAVVSLGQGLANNLILNDNSAQFMSFSKGTSVQDNPSSLMGSIALIRQTLYDAKWYQNAWSAFDSNPNQQRPEKNISLQTLANVVNKKQPVVFGVSNYLDLMRASKIADEFGLKFIYKSGGDEYKRLDDIKKLKATLIVPVNFPAKPFLTSADFDADITLGELKHWDTAPENAARLAKAGIHFAFTTNGLKDKKAFLKNVRQAVNRGLDKKTALAALTIVPAKIAGISQLAGSLEKGKSASFIISDKDIFEENATIQTVVVEGKRYEINQPPENDVRGKWLLKSTGFENDITLSIEGKIASPKASFQIDSLKLKSSGFSIKGSRIVFNITSDTLSINAPLRFTGRVTAENLSGKSVNAKGEQISWTGKKIDPFNEKEKKKKGSKKNKLASFETTFPNKAYGRKSIPAVTKTVAITNATIWTAGEKGTLENSDIIFMNGKVLKIGKGLSIPNSALKIDGTGLHITPGIIDEHSHIAISRGVNEGSEAVTAEVRIGDVLNPDNIHIYRQLAGGVTTSQLLHGSANPIGGQAQVIKLRWGANADGLKYKHAPPSIKFALGENVKQSNWGDNYNSRYPQTRMGVREIMWDTFQRARDYEKEMMAYEKLSSSKKKQTVPPRRNLELDTVLEILNSERFIHCHSYVQSEILMLMRLAEEFDFRVATFTHILEGYKVAKEMAEHGAMASTFADWWNYKFEVYEAMPYNTALMANNGVVSSVNSDDAEMARRLNQEAAKAIKYGGLSKEEAIKLVTINPARQLKIDKHTGSLEIGKEADFVIWNDDPLSIYASVVQTWIEGRKYFDVEEDKLLRKQIKDQRTALIKKALLSGKDNGNSKGNGQRQKPPKEDYKCDDLTDYIGGLE